MPTRPSAPRPPALDLLLLALLPLLIQAPGLLGWIDSDPLLRLSVLAIPGHPGWLPGFPGWIDPNVGTTTQTLGHLAAADLLAGRMPWWNPYSGIGVPLAAEMQPAALFLPFVLLLRLAHGLLWLRAAMGAVAGLATYELLRTLGMRRAACLAGAVLFALNGTAAWLPHGPDRAAAFLPLILLGIERATGSARTGRRLGWLWLAAGLAWSVAAGFPETAYLDGLLAALWGLWRLAPGPWAVRWRLAAKLVAALAVALLVTAPAWWPFLQLLRHCDMGGHAAGFAHIPLPRPAWPMLLLPYVIRPYLSLRRHRPGGATEGVWGAIGGYAGAAAMVLALARLCGGRAGDGGLRWLLTAWVALCVAKTAALPGVTAVVNMLPGMRLVAFFRYAEPSWELALALLAAGAIDAFAAGRLGRGRVLTAALAAAALLAAALWRASGTLALLAAEPGAMAFAIGSAVWCALVIAAATWLLSARPRRGRVAALAFLACLDAVATFALPFASATQGGRIDRAPLDFLRAHLGLQRFFALAAIPANYGALYGVPQLNDDTLPMPANWAGHIRVALDPLATPTWFSGSIGDRPPGPDPRAMLLSHLDAYRALGVRYVVTMRGPDSLSAERATAPAIWAPRRPWALPPGATLAGTLPPGFVTGGPIDALAVEIGTYAGQANGTLAVTLCAGAICAHGQAALRGAADNRSLDMPLSPPLPVPPGTPLRFTLMHEGGSAPVAIWEAAGGPAAAVRPALTLSWPRPGVNLPRVFRDSHVDIFEVPGAAPYFSADPPCALVPAGRLSVVADCPRPATLTRRELAFPGWRAWRDGREATLAADGVVQTVALPAGRSAVRFAYAPPRIAWTYAMALLGLLWVAAACLGWRG